MTRLVARGGVAGSPARGEPPGMGWVVYESQHTQKQ